MVTSNDFYFRQIATILYGNFAYSSSIFSRKMFANKRETAWPETSPGLNETLLDLIKTTWPDQAFTWPD